MVSAFDDKLRVGVRVEHAAVVIACFLNLWEKMEMRPSILPAMSSPVTWEIKRPDRIPDGVVQVREA